MTDHQDGGRARALDWQIAPGKPPITLAPRLDGIEAACEWLTAVRPELTGMLHEHGAVYLRGLPISEVEHFAKARDVLIATPTPYREKATPRSNFGNGVFSSTDLPPSQPIHMHNENSYTLTFPGVLIFACLVAPAEGGATPVADCRKVLSLLPDELVREVRASGWLLTRSYSEYVSTDWRTAFASEDRGEVERYCTENLIAYEWLPDGNLRTGQLRPGIIEHPVTGEEVWFNHLAFWNEWSLDEELRGLLIDEFGRDGLPFNTAPGNGRALAETELKALLSAYEAAAVREAWRPGDLLLVDNVLSAHGRDPFRGERKIVVAMGEPVELADCRASVEPATALLP